MTAPNRIFLFCAVCAAPLFSQPVAESANWLQTTQSVSDNVDRLSDSSYKTSHKALQELSGDPDGAAKIIVERFEAFKNAGRQRALIILEKAKPLGDADLEKVVKFSKADPQRAVRMQLTLYSSTLGDRGRPILNDLLNDQDSEVRWLATEYLGQLTNPADKPAFEKMAADKDLKVRLAALRALGKQGDVRGRPLALQVLDTSSNWREREAAVRLLGDVGTKTDIPILESVRDSPKEKGSVRFQSTIAIRHIDLMAHPESERLALIKEAIADGTGAAINFAVIELRKRHDAESKDLLQSLKIGHQ